MLIFCSTVSMRHCRIPDHLLCVSPHQRLHRSRHHWSGCSRSRYHSLIPWAWRNIDVIVSTENLKANLSAFIYGPFHGDFSPLIGTTLLNHVPAFYTLILHKALH